MTLVDALSLLVAIWLVELLFAVVLLALALVLSFRRDPPRWWHRRIPDEVPDDFGPLRYAERPGREARDRRDRLP
jgi:hypothetical protein